MNALTRILGSILLWAICFCIAYRIRKKKTPAGEEVKIFPVILTAAGIYFLILVVITMIAALTLVPTRLLN
jgi:hypothetical protein